MNAMIDESRFRHVTDCVSCAYGEGIAILDLRTNLYFSLDPVGALIWEKLQNPCYPHEIISAVAAEYEIAPEQCADDIAALLSDLESNHLIEPVE